LLPKKTSSAPNATYKTTATTGSKDETKVTKPQRSLLKTVVAKARPKSASVSNDDEEESETAAQQLAKLEAAANANKEEWAAMLQAKLEEWKEMKAAGLLDRLKDLGEEGDNEVDYEQMVEQLDQEMSSKRLLRRQRGTRKEDKKVGIITDDVGGNGDDNHGGTGIEISAVGNLSINAVLTQCHTPLFHSFMNTLFHQVHRENSCCLSYGRNWRW
jgi:hypothetical protein